MASTSFAEGEMDQPQDRVPRQGYSDMNERQRQGVPALKHDETGAAGGASREQSGSAGPGAGEAPNADAASDAATSSDAHLAGQGGLAPAVDEGGADSGGQRSGGDGGMSSATGG